MYVPTAIDAGSLGAGLRKSPGDSAVHASSPVTSSPSDASPCSCVMSTQSTSKTNRSISARARSLLSRSRHSGRAGDERGTGRGLPSAGTDTCTDTGSRALTGPAGAALPASAQEGTFAAAVAPAVMPAPVAQQPTPVHMPGAPSAQASATVSRSKSSAARTPRMQPLDTLHAVPAAPATCASESRPQQLPAAHTSASGQLERSAAPAHTHRAGSAQHTHAQARRNNAHEPVTQHADGAGGDWAQALAARGAMTARGSGTAQGSGGREGRHRSRIVRPAIQLPRDGDNAQSELQRALAQLVAARQQAPCGDWQMQVLALPRVERTPRASAHSTQSTDATQDLVSAASHTAAQARSRTPTRRLVRFPTAAVPVAPLSRISVQYGQTRPFAATGTLPTAAVPVAQLSRLTIQYSQTEPFAIHMRRAGVLIPFPKSVWNCIQPILR